MRARRAAGAGERSRRCRRTGGGARAPRRPRPSAPPAEPSDPSGRVTSHTTISLLSGCGARVKISLLGGLRARSTPPRAALPRRQARDGDTRAKRRELGELASRRARAAGRRRRGRCRRPGSRAPDRARAHRGDRQRDPRGLDVDRAGAAASPRRAAANTALGVRACTLPASRAARTTAAPEADSSSSPGGARRGRADRRRRPAGSRSRPRRRRAAVELAVDHDAHADAGADPQEARTSRRRARRRPQLAEGGHVHVVLEADGGAQLVADRADQAGRPNPGRFGASATAPRRGSRTPAAADGRVGDLAPAEAGVAGHVVRDPSPICSISVAELRARVRSSRRATIRPVMSASADPHPVAADVEADDPAADSGLSS